MKKMIMKKLGLKKCSIRVKRVESILRTFDKFNDFKIVKSSDPKYALRKNRITKYIYNIGVDTYPPYIYYVYLEVYVN